MTANAFPLAWPPGWKRTAERTRAKFTKKGRGSLKDAAGNYQGWDSNKPLTISQATERVRAELRRFGVADADLIISTNLKLRLDGLPRSDLGNPADPGAAVYWTKGKEGQRCMAVDRYERVADNLAAIAATLDAMRAIERHGGALILDRAFAGFKSLPAPEQPWQVLGLSSHATKEEVDRAYKRLAFENHPDRGGDEQQMMRINRARDALLETAS